MESPLSADDLAALRAAADGARSLHYGRYSGFCVLAAARTTTGAIGGGSNVENVNFSLTKHAEEVAILSAFREGGTSPGPGTLELVYVAGAMPCGSCRQFAIEFGTPDALWIIEDVSQEDLRDGLLADLPTPELLLMTFAEALPAAFATTVPGLRAAGSWTPT
jgi:cytidine deaminase